MPEKKLAPDPEPVDGGGSLRLGVHDASRVEWIVTLPLGTDCPFELEFTAEIPANLVSSFADVWDHLQEFGRLHSPDTDGSGAGTGNDDLRRAALAAAHKIKVLQDRHARACMVANSLFLQAPRQDVSSELEAQRDEGLALVEEARARLAVQVEAGASPAEVRLADEFLSNKVLEFLSALDHDLVGTLTSEDARFRSEYRYAASGLRQRIAVELAGELRRRSGKGILNPSAEDSAALEAYLDRASHLKKHFQEVLFLDMSSQHTENKVRNILTAVAAVVAGIFYVYAMAGPTRLDIGLGTTALLTGALLAMRDRIKESVKGWLSHRITRLYGSRAVALKIPSRLMPGQPVLIRSRDVFQVTYEKRHDALNPEVGATRMVAVFRFTKKGRVVEQKPAVAQELARKGMRSVKQIFRFDLSSIFPRLDDPLKRVPVLSNGREEVRWVDAPRTYHFPASVRLTTPEGTETRHGEIVAQKSGISRFDGSKG